MACKTVVVVALREAKQRKLVGDDHKPNQESTERQPNMDIQSSESTIDTQSNAFNAGVESAPVPVELNFESSEETVTRTRSGRISRKPNYLNDYYT